MKSKVYLFHWFCICGLLIVGCGGQPRVERMTLGSDIITVDGSSGLVQIFHSDTSGVPILIYNTGAAQRLGWHLVKVAPDRLKLSTSDLGDFDIFRDASGWQVIPDGIFLSPTRANAVKLTAEGNNIKAQIGEIEPPYTDLWVAGEVTIVKAKRSDLKVSWLNSDQAQIRDVAGRVVGDLSVKEKHKVQ